MKAIWNNEIIAESDNTVAVEGTIIFHPNLLRYNTCRRAVTSIPVFGKVSETTTMGSVFIS